MGVGDICERDRHAGLLHLGDVAKAHLGGDPVETRKPRVQERVPDLASRRVVDNRLAARDGGVDVLGAEQGLEAGVAAGLIGEQVGASAEERQSGGQGQSRKN